jgi:hypothetical protein
MSTWKTYALATSVTLFGGLAASAAIGHRTAAAKQTQGVVIDGPLPLPVTGTVMAEQGGPWNVGLLGTPSVNIANSPTVSLSNSAAAPLFVVNLADRGRSPYQFSGFYPDSICPTGTGKSCRFNVPQAVPFGKRLVVEHITGDVEFAGVPNFVAISVSNEQGGSILQFQLENLSPSNSFERSVLFYVDGGQTYAFSALEGLQSSFAQGGGVGHTFGATGYLIDCGVAPCAPLNP